MHPCSFAVSIDPKEIQAMHRLPLFSAAAALLVLTTGCAPGDAPGADVLLLGGSVLDGTGGDAVGGGPGGMARRVRELGRMGG